MLFNFDEATIAGAEVNDELDQVINKDPDTPEGVESLANDVENLMQQSALESVTYFERGDEALKNFMESAEVQALVESRKMSKRTYVRLGKNDDLHRRANLAALLIAKEKRDPLFKKLALNRVNERKLRNAIFARYGKQGLMIAKRSQTKHIKAMKSMPALPVIKF